MHSTEIICETIGYDLKNVVKEDRLTEVAVGQWAGLTTKEIESSWPNLFITQTCIIGILMRQMEKLTTQY